MSITKSLPAASEFQPGRRNGLRSHGLSFEWTRREETLTKESIGIRWDLCDPHERAGGTVAGRR